MNINKDIKETIRLTALDNLAKRAGITLDEVQSAKELLTISNKDAMESQMEQVQQTMPQAAPPMPMQSRPANPERIQRIEQVKQALSTDSALDNIAVGRMMQAREGGSVYKGYSGMVPGEGHGMQDNVYMPIVDRKEGEQVATLAVSPDEYIVDAATVAALGNGSSDAGAEVLDETIKDIRQEAFGTTKQPNQINGLASLQQAIESNIG
jgi:hypothetical protein|tara:strand:+ start:276 stop:902 length:627 start_codon:yes stop_codon:yes gene_type:complete